MPPLTVYHFESKKTETQYVTKTPESFLFTFTMTVLVRENAEGFQCALSPGKQAFYVKSETPYGGYDTLEDAPLESISAGESILQACGNEAGI